MKRILIIILLIFPTLLLSQTHLVIPGKTSTTVSFGRDQNIDFFGEGKFVRSSYGNKINVGYVYKGLVGLDFSYGYSYFDRKDTYTFDLTGEQSNPDGDPQFNFTESFRSDNPNVDILALVGTHPHIDILHWLALILTLTYCIGWHSSLH